MENTETPEELAPEVAEQERKRRVDVYAKRFETRHDTKSIFEED